MNIIWGHYFFFKITLLTLSARTCSRSLRTTGSFVRTGYRNRSSHGVDENFEPKLLTMAELDIKQTLKIHLTKKAVSFDDGLFVEMIVKTTFFSNIEINVLSIEDVFSLYATLLSYALQHAHHESHIQLLSMQDVILHQNPLMLL